MRKECEDYLKDKFINSAPAGSTYKPTEEDWNRMPREHKDYMIDLVLGFKSNNELMDKIMIEFNKKHSDISFGIEVKSIIRKYK